MRTAVNIICKKGFSQMNNSNETRTKPVLSSEVLGFIYVTITTIAYGVTPVISQLAYTSGLNSYSLVFGRYLFGMLFYMILILVTRESFKITLRQFAYIMYVAFWGMLAILTAFIGYNYLSGGIASMIGMLYIAFVIIFEILLKRAKAEAYKMIALAAAAIGILMVLWSPADSEGGGISIIGFLLLLASAVAAGVQIIVFDSKIISDVPVPTIFFYEMILPLTTIPIIASFLSLPPFPAGTAQWFYSAAVASVNLFIGILLFYKAVRLIGPGNASIIGVFEPVFATIAGVVVMGDTFTMRTIIGGIIVIGSIFTLKFIEARR